MVQILGSNKKVIKVGKIDGNCDVLTVEGELIAVNGNDTKRVIEMTLK